MNFSHFLNPNNFLYNLKTIKIIRYTCFGILIVSACLGEHTLIYYVSCNIEIAIPDFIQI